MDTAVVWWKFVVFSVVRPFLLVLTNAKEIRDFLSQNIWDWISQSFLTVATVLLEKFPCSERVFVHVCTLYGKHNVQKLACDSFYILTLMTSVSSVDAVFWIHCENDFDNTLMFGCCQAVLSQCPKLCQWESTQEAVREHGQDSRLELAKGIFHTGGEQWYCAISCFLLTFYFSLSLVLGRELWWWDKQRVITSFFSGAFLSVHHHGSHIIARIEEIFQVFKCVWLHRILAIWWQILTSLDRGVCGYRGRRKVFSMPEHVQTKISPQLHCVTLCYRTVTIQHFRLFLGFF